MDGRKNQQETDIDCGGNKCGKCQNGKTCLENNDCTSDFCDENKCATREYCIFVNFQHFESTHLTMNYLIVSLLYPATFIEKRLDKILNFENRFKYYKKFAKLMFHLI